MRPLIELSVKSSRLNRSPWDVSIYTIFPLRFASSIRRGLTEEEMSNEMQSIIGKKINELLVFFWIKYRTSAAPRKRSDMPICKNSPNSVFSLFSHVNIL